MPHHMLVYLGQHIYQQGFRGARPIENGGVCDKVVGMLDEAYEGDDEFATWDDE